VRQGAGRIEGLEGGASEANKNGRPPPLLLLLLLLRLLLLLVCGRSGQSLGLSGGGPPPVEPFADRLG
jgi:hypothetical protein